MQTDSRELKLALRIGESGICSHLAPRRWRSWISSGSEKKPHSVSGLPAGYRGIIQAACNLPIWPTTSSARQKKSSRKISQRNRTACSPQVRESADPRQRAFSKPPLALHLGANPRACRGAAGFIFRVAPYSFGLGQFLAFYREGQGVDIFHERGPFGRTRIRRNALR